MTERRKTALFVQEGVEHIQLSEMKGIGPKRAAALAAMGIHSCEEVIRFAPTSYQDMSKVRLLSEVQDGETALFELKFSGKPVARRSANGRKMLMIHANDVSGSAILAWFNSMYLFSAILANETYRVYGRISVKGKRIYILQPTFARASAAAHMVGIIPVYPLPNGCGISQKLFRELCRAAIDSCAVQKELFPVEFRNKYMLAERSFAVENIHFPISTEALGQAKRRLAFEQLIFFQILIDYYCSKRDMAEAERLEITFEQKKHFLNQLPFTPTVAQQRVMAEIEADLLLGKPMNRLLQGDVGSGKTVIAFYCLFIAAANGGQAVLMAPTEVLAQQHYEEFKKLYPKIKTAFLAGSTKKSEKEQIKRQLASGELSIVIGTHAILQQDVCFYRLYLVITDEQHRFGVAHRAALDFKGQSPHTLVMSATPIPRTLSLILFHDLALSVLNELPPGRHKVSTHIIEPAKEEALFGFLHKCALEGKQSYVVCPLIEENEELPVFSAQEMFERLRENMPDISVALLHGKMAAKAKAEVMQRFSEGSIAILVSTTVIEVGINVPNAINMVIEGADRFGLSQLHQLRGRVGRGSEQSYCFLLADKANERLKTMVSVHDGFLIAQKDLELRGPGDYFGKRQSGMPDTVYASMFADMSLLKKSQEAMAELKSNPRLRFCMEALQTAARQSISEEEPIVYN